MTSDETNNGDNDKTPDVNSRNDYTLIEQRHYDQDQEIELATTIVFAIAEAMDVSPSELDLPPLYEYIDAGALEGTFFRQGESRRDQESDGSVEFTYSEYLVQVDSDGWIRVFEASDTATA